MVVRAKRLRQPKYLIGAIIGSAYFYFYFYRFLFRGDFRGAPLLSAVCPCVVEEPNMALIARGVN